MTRAFPGPVSMTHTGFAVIGTSVEYPVGLENSLSTTPGDSMFVDGSGALLPGAIWSPVQALITQVPGTATVTLSDHGGTAFPGLALTSSTVVAGGIGADLTEPDVIELDGHARTGGLSFQSTSASYVCILTYRARGVRL